MDPAPRRGSPFRRRCPRRSSASRIAAASARSANGAPNVQRRALGPLAAFPACGYLLSLLLTLPAAEVGRDPAHRMKPYSVQSQSRAAIVAMDRHVPVARLTEASYFQRPVTTALTRVVIIEICLISPSVTDHPGVCHWLVTLPKGDRHASWGSPDCSGNRAAVPPFAGRRESSTRVPNAHPTTD